MKTRGTGPVPDILDERALTIWVDGSMRVAPRRGGIGIHIVWVNDAGNEEAWDHSLPATAGATNNEMELEAPTEALKLAASGDGPFQLQQFDKIVIRTDSLYVYENWRNAAWTWSKTRWTTKGGAAVLSSPSWKALIAEMRSVNQRHRLIVRFEWIRGKEGRHAKIVDKLAKKSSDSPSFGRARASVVRRKLSSESVERGSVTMSGQTIIVRIIVAKYLPPPRRSSLYKYEVVEEGNPFHGKVDWAQSDLDLKAGHTYLVRMNDVQANPRIEEVIQELEEDLRPYLDALVQLGRPSTARQVAEELTRARGIATSTSTARLRLDRLRNSGRVHRDRAMSVGRPYVYEPPSLCADLARPANVPARQLAR